jgi:hypothetical protein
MKRSSPLRQLHVIFHALRTHNQCITCRVEHFEHKSANINCRGFISDLESFLIKMPISTIKSVASNQQIEHVLFSNRHRPISKEVGIDTHE